jgi:hypothetical protein
VLWPRYSRIKIIPVWIVLFDEPNLPRTIPFLQALFAEDRLLDVIKLLKVYQPVYSVLFRKSLDESHPMLIYPSDEIVCDSNIQRAANSARQDIDPITMLRAHRLIIAFTGSSAYADDDTEIDGPHP